MVSEVNMEELVRLGKRIKDERVKKKMTQQELAYKSNLSLPNISKIECGKAQLRLMTFVQIAEALQVSTDELLRPNIPSVKGVYSNEFSELFDDCTPAEIESMLAVVREFKARLRSQKENYD